MSGACRDYYQGECHVSADTYRVARLGPDTQDRKNYSFPLAGPLTSSVSIILPHPLSNTSPFQSESPNRDSDILSLGQAADKAFGKDRVTSHQQLLAAVSRCFDSFAPS